MIALAVVGVMPPPVFAQTVSLTFENLLWPEEQGWTRIEQPKELLSERAIEDGWFVLRPVLLPCPPQCTTQDHYRYQLLPQSGAIRWQMSWTMETDGPLAPGAVAPASIVAGGQSGIRYHFTIGVDELVFNRGSQFPLVFHSFEPGIHEGRIEIFNDTDPASYTFYFDGAIFDSGEALGSYPTDDSAVVFGGRAAIVDSETRWLEIEFGEIQPEPIPAVSTWGAAVLGLLTLTTATIVFKLQHRSLLP